MELTTRAAILRSVCTERPYSDSSPLSVETVQIKEPRDGDVLLRIEAAGICHSDLSVIDGTRPRPVPMALGHEAAGTIEIAGKATGLESGMRVVCSFVPSCGACRECLRDRPYLCDPAAAANAGGTLLGGAVHLETSDGEPVHHHLGVSAFAQHAVVARESVVVIEDDTVPFETLALFGCAGLTGVGAVFNTARVRSGDSVAIFGLGGVGLAALLGARAAGAEPVIGVDPVEEKRNLAVSLGAGLAVSPEEAPEAIADLSSGGVDFAFETAGLARVLESAFASLRRGGTAIAIGLPHPDNSSTFPALGFAGAGKSIVGSYMGSSHPQRDIPRYLALWKEGKLPIDRLLSHTLSLDDVNQAMENLAAGHAVRQVLLPWPAG